MTNETHNYMKSFDIWNISSEVPQFRVWDKDKKEWVKHNVFIDMYGQAYRFTGDNLTSDRCGIFGITGVEKIENVVICRFTGLYNSNILNIPIYENYIVAHANDVHGKNSKIVRLSEGGFYPFSVSNHEEPLNAEDCFVLGNIFDNPELLEVINGD